MRKTVSDWLARIASFHPSAMDLSLERVTCVAKRLGCFTPGKVVITVGGTNGKGSTVAALEAIYVNQGYRVGAFSSPFLISFNEQIRINQQNVMDEQIISAFEMIDRVRSDITLTTFEFTALAALFIFTQTELDVCLLEVGLGGRFDAVNCVDADLSIITSIDLDHVEWLGNTRELIGFEKAGIFRQGKPVVCGDLHPPVSLIDHAKTLQCPFYALGKDFTFDAHPTHWSWQSPHTHFEKLPLPILALENVSTALMGVDCLQALLPVSEKTLQKALTCIKLAGRLQYLTYPHAMLLDVSHNPAGARWLKRKISTLPYSGKKIAIFSMLKDKDIIETLKVMESVIDEWHIVELPSPRAASLSTLQTIFDALGLEAITHAEIKSAYDCVSGRLENQDLLIIFGSFLMVAEIVRSENILLPSL